jgi:methylglutaconyl-CoA hydratase
MSADAAVLIDRRGSALWITINRPDKRNAVNAEVIAGIRRGYAEAHADPEVRVIVLTGAGAKAFCAGADLQPAQNATLPAIARINGVCMAGGIGLLCMTDFAIATDSAVFGLPEVKVGLFPMQVLSLLQQLVPRRVMLEWCVTGEPFDARTAQGAGLLNHVVPAADLDAKVEWLIGRIADKSPTAIRRGKYALRALGSMSFDEAIAYTESQIALLVLTEDAKEGLASFNERRAPRWTGR